MLNDLLRANFGFTEQVWAFENIILKIKILLLKKNEQNVSNASSIYKKSLKLNCPHLANLGFYQ